MFLDRRALSATRRLDQDQAGRRVGSSQGDPYLAAWLNTLDGNAAGPRVESGVVCDVVPDAFCYLVSAGIRSFLYCSPGGTTGAFGATGVRPLTTYPMGTIVYFIRHPQTPYVGTIIAAEPPYLNPDQTDRPLDSAWPFVRSGRIEPAHKFRVIASLALGAQGEVQLGHADMADFSGGRIIDSTSVGEFGGIAETGVGIFADPFQVQMRVDEATGVFGFYSDQLLRVAGHNYQHFTSIVDQEQLDDEGELHGVKRETVYPWENFGLWRYNQITPGWSAPLVPNAGLPPGQGVAFTNPLDVQAGSGYAAREPEILTVLPAARKLAWEGYLGQGGKQMVVVPAQLEWAYPLLPEGVRIAEPILDTIAPGAFDPLTGLPLVTPEGRVTLEGISIPEDVEEFDPATYEVPVNQRATFNFPAAAPDQPGVLDIHQTLAGDLHYRFAHSCVFTKRTAIPVPRQLARPEDPYGDKPAGYSPSGLNADGAVTHAVSADPDIPGGPIHRLCALPCVLSYLFNWVGLHQFAYHTKDWHVAEEGAAGSNAVNQQPPDYAELKVIDYLDTPTPIYLDVDHRYNEVAYYENESVFAMHPDGGISLTDGWGSEIRMVGGNIEIHAAGDIRFFTGRNVVTWAGHDFTVKAQNSVDMVAVKGDMRSAAGRNSQHMAGGDGCGGFVFEAKSSCPVYSFDGKLGEHATGSGFVVITPNSQTVILSQDIVLKLEPTADDGKIALDAGSDREIVTWSKSQTHRVADDGSIIHLFGVDLDVTASAVNEFSATYNLFEGRVYSKSLLRGASGTFTGNDSSLNTRVTDLKTYADDYANSLFVPDELFDVEFSFRTSSQYLSTEFSYWRSKWQAIATADEQDLPLWEELSTIGLRSDEETRPHPGERWIEEGSYMYCEPKFVDPATGWVAKNRNTNRTDYEGAVIPAPIADSLENSYFVTVPVCVTTTTTTTTAGPEITTTTTTAGP